MTELDKLVKDMQKKFGAGSVMTMKDGEFPVIERIPVASPKVADVLGGGIPRGKIMELYGPASSGKTSLSCYFAAQVQKHTFSDKDRKGVVAFIDAEHALDPLYAKTFGFDIENAIFAQPDSGEQALDIAISLAESGKVDFIVIDSIAALTPQSEIEGDVGSQQMGAQARMLGKAVRKLAPILDRNKCALLFINQIRMTMALMGNPETQPGGNAVKFFASIRLEVRKVEFITEKQQIVGLLSRLKGVKNKTAPPMRKQEIEFFFGKGIDSYLEWVDFAISTGIIQQGGPWYTLPEQDVKFKGKSDLLDYLKENTVVYEKIIEDTKKIMWPSGTQNPVSDVEKEIVNKIEEEDED